MFLIEELCLLITQLCHFGPTQNEPGSLHFRDDSAQIPDSIRFDHGQGRLVSGRQRLTTGLVGKVWKMIIYYSGNS